MSIQVMTEVWSYAPVKGSELLTLLAIADNADTETRLAWPGIVLLSKKTRMNHRQVRRIVLSLEAKGMIAVQRTPGSANRYVVSAQLVSDKWGQDVPGTQLSPLPRDISMFGVGTQLCPGGGDTAMSPEPSRTVSKRTISESARRRTRIPTDFSWTDERKAVAVKHRVRQPAEEFAKFVTHFEATGGLMLDWDKAWLKWCLRSHEFSGGNGNGNGHRERFQATQVIPSAEQTRREHLKRMQGE